MSKLVYIVEERFHAVDVEDLINGPYIDTMIVQILPTRDAAENWVELNYTKFLNRDPRFCDLIITEKEISNDPGFANTKDCIDLDTRVDAWVSKDLYQVRISGFTRNQRKDRAYYDSFDGRYYITARIPRMINCRKSLVEFLVKKAKEVKIDK